MYKKKVVFFAACAGILLFGISLIILGSFTADLREKLQLDEFAAGTLFSILPLGVLTGSLLFGPIADKYGYKILLSACCIFMFIGFEGVAFSQSVGLLKLCTFFFGIGGGAINGSTNALVADISDKDKGANISLLGVFYGIGALGTPLLTGFLHGRFNFEVIVSSIGFMTLLIGIAFLLINFPPPKQKQGLPLKQAGKLIKDNVLLLIAFFLFFQSGFEGIMNNWTATYLVEQRSVAQSNALYGLSSLVAGMTIMRLMMGSTLRSVPAKKIMIITFIFLLLGVMFLKVGDSFWWSVAGLVFTGAGLASGFPVMLGFVGDRYPEISGTAFSMVLFVALLGNTLINYGLGYVAKISGIQHLVTFAFAETLIMILLCLAIFLKVSKEK